ncbi:MAG: class I SAM-dependent methyltransferase [Candidatus Marinimicrobia bacterium]|nr:class I SAM-dependent methyltransferase [Candidatus Neomarinimicrobiota bacterium]MDP6935991.1 class I SAM-dependent methyltransferase [Candidatus Neomarinimicrobiota bacterium]
MQLIRSLDKLELSPHYLEKYLKVRQSLLENHSMIEVTDFGKGSKFFTSNQRKVSSIAKVAGISKKNGEQLIKFVHQFQPQHILEIGTSLGLGTSCLSLGNPNADIISLEGCPETATVATSLLQESGLTNIEIKIGEFEKTLPEVTEKRKFDLIYFDGNHSYEATNRYVEICLKTKTPHTIWIFDDINWSKGMNLFWQEFKRKSIIKNYYENWNWGVVRLDG